MKNSSRDLEKAIPTPRMLCPLPLFSLKNSRSSLHVDENVASHPDLHGRPKLRAILTHAALCSGSSRTEVDTKTAKEVRMHNLQSVRHPHQHLPAQRLTVQPKKDLSEQYHAGRGVNPLLQNPTGARRCPSAQFANLPSTMTWSEAVSARLAQKRHSMCRRRAFSKSTQSWLCLRCVLELSSTPPNRSPRRTKSRNSTGHAAPTELKARAPAQGQEPKNDETRHVRSRCGAQKGRGQTGDETENANRAYPRQERSVPLERCEDERSPSNSASGPSYRQLRGFLAP
ncbi:hypothetical protein BU26DRAFT_590319 [Trematosphaeria pertusa]|uniref:Uncharacterized protein n=1 Tax=Trematosphaeria pertusa TaxID=390896 RepID=A0A6A6IR26_9PLEO|nr:uncharacterized protein BU26DRAFT_590319 [Trematosphaeria pertusa]KAF2251983.1 hypothetical protein BU26DRAFT_590319 [Trematosphaeria pertusa]